MDDKITGIILDSIKELKIDIKDMNNKIDYIKDNMITNEECKNNRNSCDNIVKIEEKKSEWSYKKIVVIGTVITGSITAITTGIIGIIKIIGSISQ